MCKYIKTVQYIAIPDQTDSQLTRSCLPIPVATAKGISGKKIHPAGFCLLTFQNSVVVCFLKSSSDFRVRSNFKYILYPYGPSVFDTFILDRSRSRRKRRRRRKIGQNRFYILLHTAELTSKVIGVEQKRPSRKVTDKRTADVAFQPCFACCHFLLLPLLHRHCRRYRLPHQCACVCFCLSVSLFVCLSVCPCMC